jgi:hypothetical protein
MPVVYILAVLPLASTRTTLPHQPSLDNQPANYTHNINANNRASINAKPYNLKTYSDSRAHILQNFLLKKEKLTTITPPQPPPPHSQCTWIATIPPPRTQPSASSRMWA